MKRKDLTEAHKLAPDGSSVTGNSEIRRTVTTDLEKPQWGIRFEH
jgi:hypothetical protein